MDKVSLMDYTGAVMMEIPAGETGKITVPNATTKVSIPISVSTPIRSVTGSGIPSEPFLSWNRSGGPVRFLLAGMIEGMVVMDIRDFRGFSVFGGKMELGAASAPAVFPWEMENARGRGLAPGLYFAAAKQDRSGRKTTGTITRIRILG